MNELVPTWRKFATRTALGLLLTAAALCLGPSSARAWSGGVAHGGSRATGKSAALGKGHKASLRNVAYRTKTTTRRRRRRSRRHHITLPKQPSAERTQEIQSALQRGGYYRGDPTGKWDATTQDSLRRFQAANGLPPTGKLDALSLQKMGLGSDVAGVSAPRPVNAGNSPSSSASVAPKTPGR